jgi:hypothetical protein
MVSLVYVSTAQDISPNDTDDILSYSKTNNKEKGITGILHYNEPFFLQCLEGDRKDVNVLYNKIICDERHMKPMILNYSTINKRRFTGWSMAFVQNKKVKNDAILKHSLNKNFDPL